MTEVPPRQNPPSSPTRPPARTTVQSGGPPLAKEESGLPNFSAWQLAWELGYTIAIPIVLFALIGRYADKVLGTSPWMLLAGVVVSVVVSSALVYRKVKKIL